MQEKSEITLSKAKLDVINKDKANVRTDESFYMTLHFDPQADHELLRLEAKTRQIFFKYGTCIMLQQGDLLIPEHEAREEEHVYLIASGSVQGFVNESSLLDGGNVSHKLGRSAAEACSLGKGNVSGDCTRVPNVCIMGAGTIVGAAQFLSAACSMQYRARTPCEVFKLTRTPRHHHHNDFRRALFQVQL